MWQNNKPGVRMSSASWMERIRKRKATECELRIANCDCSDSLQSIFQWGKQAESGVYNAEQPGGFYLALMSSYFFDIVSKLRYFARKFLTRCQTHMNTIILKANLDSQFPRLFCIVEPFFIHELDFNLTNSSIVYLVWLTFSFITPNSQITHSQQSLLPIINLSSNRVSDFWVALNIISLSLLSALSFVDIVLELFALSFYDFFISSLWKEDG